MPRGPRGTFASLTTAAPASPACYVPPYLSVVGEPDGPGSITREPPPSGRDTPVDDVAHVRQPLVIREPPLMPARLAEGRHVRQDDQPAESLQCLGQQGAEVGG